ncbi:MAG: peptidase S24 [Burkholderiales bacterium]|nr:peptidase S24 [Burkholderiales bacterium]
MADVSVDVPVKKGWGGRRAGAGRKPDPNAGRTKVTTVVLTEELISKLHDLGGSRWIREQIKENWMAKNIKATSTSDFYKNEPEESPTKIPFVEAGKKPKSLNLSELLIKDPEHTFFCLAPDESMGAAGIRKGDLLVVDSKAEPQSGCIVLVRYGDEITIRRYLAFNSIVTLKSEPENGYSFPFKKDNPTWHLLGVVTSAVNNHLAHR